MNRTPEHQPVPHEPSADEREIHSQLRVVTELRRQGMVKDVEADRTIDELLDTMNELGRVSIYDQAEESA